MADRTLPAAEQAAIDRLPNNSAYWRHVRKRLARLLQRNPRGFWVQYLDAINPPDSDTAADFREMIAANPNAPVTLATVREFLQQRIEARQR